MQKWEKFLDECVKEIAKEGIVLDIGSGYPFQKEMGEYKGLFNASRYYALDYDFNYHPDMVEDIHNLPFKDSSVDAIICKAVLEHVPEPQRAVKEMYRVLREGGKIFAYVPFLHGYHGAPNYKDYYRFTKDAVKYMFRHFTKVEMVEVRGYFSTLCQFIPVLNRLATVANLLDRFTGYGVTAGYNIFARKSEKLSIKLDVGCGRNKREGYIGIDIAENSDADIMTSAVELPFKDSVISEINCSHLVEHLWPDEAQQLFNEFWRVLEDGGKISMKVDRDWTKKRLLSKDPEHRYRYREREIKDMVANFQVRNVKNEIYRFGRHLRNKIFVELVR